jgi:hypothetical protein
VRSEPSQSDIQVRLTATELHISFVLGPLCCYIFPTIACLVCSKVTRYTNEPASSVTTYAVPSNDHLTSCLLTATVDFETPSQSTCLPYAISDILYKSIPYIRKWFCVE